MAELGLKLIFTNLPTSPASRVFKDRAPLHELRTAQDLHNRIDQKLSYMDLPRSRYVVFYREVDGDRVVVDEAYFQMLLRDHFDDTVLSEALCHNPDSAASQQEFLSSKQLHNFAFEIDLENAASWTAGPQRTSADNSLTTVSRPAVKLSKENLEGANEGVCYQVDDLKFPPPSLIQWRVRGVVVAIWSKTSDICEVELADETSKNRITLVSFSGSVSSKLLEKLKGNGTQVVEVSNISCSWKTEKDRQFQKNGNPLRLTCTLATHVKVLNIHPVPRPEFSVPSPVVNDSSAARGVLTLGEGIGNAFTSRERQPNPILASASRVNIGGGATDSSSSSAKVSSSLSSCKRTPFAPISLAAAAPQPPQTATSTLCETRAQMLELQEVRRDEVKTRILLSGPPCPRCMICDIDVNDPACIDQVATLLRSSKQNGGRYIPTQGELYHKLCDNRNFLKSDTATPARYICRRTVPDIRARRHFVIHPRCAHLASDYQQQDVELGDLRGHASLHFCFLCNKPGAVVRCYHPDCDEIYHVICALFSNGYVNFGQDDPFRPVPACRKHTYIPSPSKWKRRRTEKSQLGGEDPKESDIAFDATQVLAEDLRDPDDDDDDEKP